MSQIVFYVKWTKDIASTGESVTNHLYQRFLLVAAHYYVVASSQFSAADCCRQCASYLIEKAHVCRIVAVPCHMTGPKNIGASCVLPRTTDKFLNTATVAYKNDRVHSLPKDGRNTWLQRTHQCHWRGWQSVPCNSVWQHEQCEVLFGCRPLHGRCQGLGVGTLLYSLSTVRGCWCFITHYPTQDDETVIRMCCEVIH